MRDRRRVLAFLHRSRAGVNSGRTHGSTVLLANALGLESRGCYRRSGPVFVRMKIPITGGCTCGAGCYEIKTEPALMLKKHFRDCQHVTGGGYCSAFLVSRDCPPV